MSTHHLRTVTAMIVVLFVAGCAQPTNAPPPSATITVAPVQPSTPTPTPRPTPEPTLASTGTPSPRLDDPADLATTDAGVHASGGALPNQVPPVGSTNGWYEGTPYSESRPPSTGPSHDDLVACRGNAVAFWETLFTNGAGDVNAWDATVAALPYTGGTLHTVLEADVDMMKNDPYEARFWRRDVEAGLRQVTRVIDEVWADWVHPDHAIIVLRYIGATQDYPVTDGWPPFTQPQFGSVTCTKAAGWKATDWDFGLPAGFIPPEYEYTSYWSG